MDVAALDQDWYLDNVVVPSGSERAPIGPARLRSAAWSEVAQTLRVDKRWGELHRVALTQGLVVARGQVRELGISDAEFRSLVRRRTWTVPRRGVVCPLPPSSDPQAVSGSASEIRATATALLRTGSVISHRSAASIYGLPLLTGDDRPTLTVAPGSMGCRRDDVRVQAASLTPLVLDRWFGAPVTTVARTVADLARSDGRRAGLVAADAALHERLTTPRQLREAAFRQRGWPGSRAAREIAELADGRAESVLESITRLSIYDAGLPLPDLQPWILLPGRRFRVDMLYRDRRVVVEADGLAKYVGRPDAVPKEKKRQEYLERARYRVVRVMWDDVMFNPVETLARIRAALAAGPLP